MHDEEANMFDPPMDAMSYEDELRAKLDDAERLVEVLKAECRASRKQIAMPGTAENPTKILGWMPDASKSDEEYFAARAATDALGGVE